MGKAIKTIGTAILIVGAAVATGGASLALSAGVGLGGAASLAGGTLLTVGGFSVSATTLIATGALLQATSAVQPDVKPSSSNVEWTADPNAPNRFPFGRVGGAGNIIHNATYGPDKMYVGFVGVMAASGPINGWVGFKADGLSPSFDANGKAITTDYANEMWLDRLNGDQPASRALASPTGLKNSATMPRWGSSYKLSGKAAYMYTLSENSKFTAYEGKVPTGVHTIEGLFCYDPRLDSTYPGGSGACRLDDPTTWPYTTNAYIHALSWAIGRWEGLTAGAAGAPYASMKVGGIGARADSIDMASYVEAANIFDDNGWACSAYPDADQSKAAVLDSFLQAGGGIYAERQGRISCLHRAAPRSSVVTVTADDTAGTVEYDCTTSLLDRINTIRPEFWSEANDWQMAPTAEVTSSVWREEDGQGVEVTRSKGITYNYVPGSKQARELAALQIAHTREGIRGTAPLRHYLDLEVGDCFEWDVPEAVLNGLKCIVLNVDPDLENDILNVTFVSETDGKYPFAFGQTDDPPPAPAIDALDLTVAPPETGDWIAVAGTITGDDGSEAPAIVITGAVANDTADQALFWYRRSGATDWLPAGVESPEIIAKQIAGLTNGDWETGVSYRRGRRSSTITVLAPVAIGGAKASTFVDQGALAVLDQTDTPQISPNAVTNYAASYTDGTLALSGTSFVTIQTVTFTTTGGPLEIKANFFLNIHHPTVGGISARVRIVQSLPFGGNLFDQTFAAIADDFLQGWQTPTIHVTPAAGTYTYDVIVSLSVAGAAVETVQSRLLSVQEFKR
ncbi:phage tail protein [Brevundimonas sp. LjRoot202]|uniref:phage tail protein n=1 Tax=Brevundimonas sp. LjRoot202 TaxID=3342281 RepID=UPI003ECEA18F